MVVKSTDKIQFKKIPQSAIVRVSGLLPMHYSTGELSVELEVPRKTIILWIKNGLPHTRDKQNHIWVDGRKCAVWIEMMRKSRQNKSGLADDEAFCFHCRKPVKIHYRWMQEVSGRSLISGKCSQCGCKVNKGVRVGKSQ